MTPRFADYLQRTDVSPKLQSNLKEFVEALACKSVTTEKANRLFNDFPSGEDYFARSPLCQDFNIFLAGLHNHAQYHKIDLDADTEVNIEIKSFEMVHFFRLVLITALDDLIDLDGSIRPDVLNAFGNRLADDVLAERDFKWALVSGYVTNIVFASEYFLQFMRSINIVYFSKTVTHFHEYLDSLTDLIIRNNKINFDYYTRDKINLFFAKEANKFADVRAVGSADNALQAEHNYQQLVYGEHILILARSGPENVFAIVEKFLRDRFLIEQAIMDYQLFGRGKSIDQFELLNSGRWGLDLTDNLRRLHGLLKEIDPNNSAYFGLNELVQKYQSTPVNIKHIAGIIMGVVIHKVIELVSEVQHPIIDYDRMEEILIPRQVCRQAVEKAFKSAGLNTWQNLLERITEMYYLRDAESVFTNSRLKLTAQQLTTVKQVTLRDLTLAHIDRLLALKHENREEMYFIIADYCSSMHNELLKLNDNKEKQDVDSVSAFQNDNNSPINDLAREDISGGSSHQGSSVVFVQPEMEPAEDVAQNKQANPFSVDLSDWTPIESEFETVKADAARLATVLDFERREIESSWRYTIFASTRIRCQHKSEKQQLLEKISLAVSPDDAKIVIQGASNNKSVNNKRTAEMIKRVIKL